jgi:hypothetical protein
MRWIGSRFSSMNDVTRWFRLYARLFVYAFVVITLVSWISRSLTVSILRGGIAAACLAFVIVGCSAWKNRGKPGDPTNPHQTLSVTLVASEDTARKRVVAALESIGAKSITVGGQRVSAATRWSLWSSGEQIMADISPHRESETTIEFSSRPKMRGVIIDFGHGYDIVSALAERTSVDPSA